MTESTGQAPALPPSQVEDLMHVLAKALRAQQLYLPNNPIYKTAIEALRDGFRALWAGVDELVLDVTEAELNWGGKIVYTNPDRSESVSWVLFKDGVRTITLHRGVEDEELIGFLEVVRKARTLQAEDSDDLLTLLWERDFQFIQYVFQDVSSDVSMAQLPSAQDVEASTRPAEHVRKAVEQEAPRPLEGVVRAEDFDTTLYFLDEREIEWIRDAVHQEYTQDLRRNVLAMLFDVMEVQPYATVRAELISIVENFLPYLLGASDFASVAYVLRESRAVLARARDVLPEHREVLGRLPRRLSEEPALTQLLQSLDEAATLPLADELGELFAEMRAEALPTLFSWLPRLTNARVREAVELAAERLAGQNPEIVAEAFRLPDPNAVVVAIRLVGRLKLAAAVKALTETVGHPEAAVRLAIVDALSAIATPAAIQALERTLEDADRETRIASVRVIAAHGSKSALPKIAAVVQGKSVRERDLTEKMAFFEAYGAMVGDEGVKVLDAILNSGGLLKRKEDPQTRACAAMALGRIGSEPALASLMKSAQDKEPLVRNAVNRALRGERASSMFRSGEMFT